MTAPQYVRRDIWNLESQNVWDRYTLGYANAARAMQALPAQTNVLSWGYQAAIHGTYMTGGANWDQCQHASWYFLPWHRSYLYWFERIVRSFVIREGGPTDWALPYWNWTNNRALPPAFRATTMPDGSANPLFTTHRVASYNANPPALLPAADVDPTTAMNMTSFSGPPAFGFGGANAGSGQLELRPHNVIHVDLGAPGSGQCAGGWMVDPNCAALDPIFWLHHAQIDRLWNRWIQLGGGRANPSSSAWLSRSWNFFDVNSSQVAQTDSQVLTTAALGYRYDDDPSPGALPVSAVRTLALGTNAEEEEPEVTREGEELGASGPVELGATPATASIDLADAEPERLGLALDRPAEQPGGYVTLLIDGIEVEQAPPAPYRIYINMPDADAGTDPHTPHFVGFLEWFGLEHSHHPEGPVPPARAFDITSIVHQLQAEGRWDPAEAQLTFVPGVVPPAPPGAEVPEESGETAMSAPKITVSQIRIVTE